MQNTAGSSEKTKSMFNTAIAMKDTYGLGVFYDGIYPKLIRATVSTFNYKTHTEISINDKIPIFNYYYYYIFLKVAHGVTFYVYDALLRASGADLHI